MKTAKCIVVSVALVCPYCGEDIPETYSGSLNWGVGELPVTQVNCPTCKNDCLPKKARA